MQYRSFFLSAGFLVYILFQFTSCAYPQKRGENQVPPNVILIITDDQGYGDLACHGNPYIQTPNLDVLHSESIRFTDFHVSPTCSPTRAALMTGRYTNRTGAWHTIGGWSSMRIDEKTMADMFLQAGYSTGVFGKWHLGDNYPYRAFDRGFEFSIVHGGGGIQQTPDYWNNTYFDDTYFVNGKPKKFNGYCTDVFFSEALKYIEQNKEGPFFCYISTNAPHSPFNVPTEYVEKYQHISDDTLTQIQKRFYGMITNIDDNIGQLRDRLEEWKISDNTLLIFMTDNGTAAGFKNEDGKMIGYNAGMRGTKGSEYEGGHRVPFFIYWKNGNMYGGRDIPSLSAHIDIMPTLAELCNISLPERGLPIDGQSLVSEINGSKMASDKRLLITDSQRLQKPQKWKNTAVMKGSWRLVNGVELYDIASDPSQLKDISAQNPGVFETLSDEYDEWWESVSEKYEEELHIAVGTVHESPSVLTNHDWHAENGIHLWNQLQVRNATLKGITNGYWSLDIMHSGSYEIELRRYPKESGYALNDSISGIKKSKLNGLHNDIPPGINMSIEKAWIQFGTSEKIEKNILNNQDKIVFKVNLKQGKTKFWSGFIDHKGVEFGAFYAYITRLI